MSEALDEWWILIPIGEKDFLFLTQIGEEKIQVLMSIWWRSGCLLSVGTLTSGPSWTGSMKYRSFLTWLTSPKKSISSSWRNKLKGGAAAWWDQLQLQGGAKANHLWWHGSTRNNFFKVDSFHLITNRFFTTNLRNADKAQELLGVLEKFYRLS